MLQTAIHTLLLKHNFEAYRLLMTHTMTPTPSGEICASGGVTADWRTLAVRRPEGRAVRALRSAALETQLCAHSPPPFHLPTTTPHHPFHPTSTPAHPPRHNAAGD